MEKIRDVLAAHRGSTEVRVRLQFASRRPAQLLRTSYQVDVSPALMADLKALIGAGAIT